MLSYDDKGSGLPVVLIHGFPLCRRMWQPQIAALSDAGFRVICPDLPGFGETPISNGAVSIGTYADEIIALLDQLGIEKAVIGGMSMGGYVLLNLLERYPDRVLGAMLLVTRAAADDAAGKEKRTLLAGQVCAGNRLVVPETFAEVLFAQDTPLKNPALVDEVRQWMESTSAEGTAAGLLAMRDREDSVAQLSRFALPALVVGAEHDHAVPLEHSRTLVEGLPDAELQVIPGAGHMANLEQPELFNAALLAFLDRFASSQRTL